MTTGIVLGAGGPLGWAYHRSDRLEPFARDHGVGRRLPASQTSRRPGHRCSSTRAEQHASRAAPWLSKLFHRWAHRDDYGVVL